MKLSNIPGERALTVLADIIEPLGIIMSDEEIQKMIKAKATMFTVLAKALKSHQEEVYSMLAVLDGVPVGEYKKSSSLGKILLDFSDVITDKSLETLFTSAKPTEAVK